MTGPHTSGTEPEVTLTDAVATVRDLLGATELDMWRRTGRPVEEVPK